MLNTALQVLGMVTFAGMMLVAVFMVMTLGKEVGAVKVSPEPPPPPITLPPSWVKQVEDIPEDVNEIRVYVSC